MNKIIINNTDLHSFRDMDAVDATIYGAHNKVKSVNPLLCYFVVKYPDGKIVKGKNLFETGWDELPQGIHKLSYVLSTGHIIEIPKCKAILPMIEVSVGVDGSRIFHFINVHCLVDKEIIVYKIVLRQDNISKWKIGDVIMSKQPLPKEMYSSWKYMS